VRGFFFDACRSATMSAASASILRSTSHRETTSTGATWMSRSRSALPYQPQPMRPTRSFLSVSAAYRLAADRAGAALAWRNFRRFMGVPSISEDELRTRAATHGIEIWRTRHQHLQDSSAQRLALRIDVGRLTGPAAKDVGEHEVERIHV